MFNQNICLRDLVLLQVLRRLEALVESEAPASSDSDLVFMTCLLQLAVGARQMLRERRYHFPEVSNDLLKTFYPILSSFILEVQLREPNETDGIDPKTAYPSNCLVFIIGMKCCA